jgi:hypothetical protein
MSLITRGLGSGLLVSRGLGLSLYVTAIIPEAAQIVPRQIRQGGSGRRQDYDEIKVGFYFFDIKLAIVNDKRIELGVQNNIRVNYINDDKLIVRAKLSSITKRKSNVLVTSKLKFVVHND